MNAEHEKKVACGYEFADGDLMVGVYGPPRILDFFKSLQSLVQAGNETFLSAENCWLTSLCFDMLPVTFTPELENLYVVSFSVS